MDNVTRTALAAEYPCLTPAILDLIQSEAYDRGHNAGQAEVNDHAKAIAHFVSLILAEYQVLTDASIQLRDDLLMRGERDDDGTIIVNASFSRWLSFNKALDALGVGL